MKKILLIIFAIGITGCASKVSNYQLYADAQAKIAQANAVAETARYNALAEIAKTGDSAAKVAAVLSIHMNNNNATPKNNVHIAPPETLGDTALKWTSVLLPNFVQFYTINRNSSVAMRQSDNQAAIAISTNKTFTDMSTAGHVANSNIANSGFNAINSSSVAGLNALNGVSVAGFNALRDTAKVPSPNITVQGNYNIGSNSGNYGKLAGTTLSDNTSTPTVVTQPTPTIVNPVVVTQPTPIVVQPTTP